MSNTSKVAAQVRVACAWTLTKTLLPDAPHAEKVKFAKILLAASTPALKVALKQTAINAHWTRVAEQFSKVHKVDLNDLLEDPSVLSKEKNEIAAELKGDPKNAATKKADDRSEAGPLPAAYPEPKRNEPAELDGSKAAEGRPSSWTEGPSAKEAGKTAACECNGKGCDKCKKEASEKKACGEGCKGCDKCKKEASAKTAEEEAPKAEGEKVEGEKAADSAAAEAAGEVAKGAEEVASEENKEVSEEAAGADPVEGDKPEETFDPAKTKLEEAAEDLEKDNDKLQEAIAELENEPSDLDIPGEAGAEGDPLGDEFTFDDGFGNEVSADDAAGGIEGDGSQELNLDDIFDEGKMSDKVSALNNEGEEIDIEFGGDEDFFKPTDPAELESVLEQEEDLSSPADMFSLEGVDDDPMARIFASAKQAAEEGVIEPGKIVNHFESSHGPEGRDAENDHEDTIFEEVLNSLKTPERTESRDTEAHLKPPAKGKEAQGPIRRLRPTPGKTASNDANLASLLFPDEADFM